MRDISSRTNRMVGNRVLLVSDREASVLCLALGAAVREDGSVLGDVEREEASRMWAVIEDGE